MSFVLLVTGTSTDIGKTYFSSQYLKYLAMQFKAVRYIKPFASGCEADASDLMSVKRECASYDNISYHSFVELKEPASPFIAAMCEGIEIFYENIVNEVQSLFDDSEPVLIEGVGGLVVPITKDKTFLDFIEDLHVPVLVVADYGLGTVNHSMLTFQALASRGVSVLGFVLNQSETSSVEVYQKAVETNLSEIERLSSKPVFGCLGYEKKYPENDLNRIFKTITASLL